MAYIDYEYYTGTFGGSDVSAEEFPRLAQMASDIVDAIVYRPIEEVTDRVKRAVCYEMDMLFTHGGVSAAMGQSDGEISYEMLGDYSVTSHDTLKASIAKYRAGDTVDVTLYRNGDYLTVSVTLTEATVNS